MNRELVRITSSAHRRTPRCSARAIREPRVVVLLQLVHGLPDVAGVALEVGERVLDIRVLLAEREPAAPGLDGAIVSELRSDSLSAFARLATITTLSNATHFTMLDG